MLSGHSALHRSEVLSASLEVLSGTAPVAGLPQAYREFLEAEGAVSGEVLTQRAGEILREQMAEKMATDAWLSTMAMDRTTFIHDGRAWRSSPLLRPRRRSVDGLPILVDADGVRECITPEWFRAVRDSSLWATLPDQELRLKVRGWKAARVAVLGVLLGRRPAVSNMVLEVEMLSGVMAQGASSQLDEFEPFWSEFTSNFQVYDFDRATMATAVTLCKLYSEMRGRPGMEAVAKGADVKDMYHYVFAVQHGVEVIISGDGFFRERIPAFLDYLSGAGIVASAARAKEVFSTFYPSLARMYGSIPLQGGFEGLLRHRPTVVNRLQNLSAENLAALLPRRTVPHS